MYSSLNEDYMFQEMHDRVERLQHGRGAHPSLTEGLPNRRWWRRGARVAR